jgi:lactoylglutathione lyase
LSGTSTHVPELVEYKSRPSLVARPMPTNDVGAAHLALIVSDIHPRYERMREGGVQFRNPPVLITEGASRGGHACYFWDPDGITLELVEPAR